MGHQEINFARHSTNLASYLQIIFTALRPGGAREHGRDCVMCSPYERGSTKQVSGARDQEAIDIFIDVHAATRAGIDFYVTNTLALVTEQSVPACFISQVIYKESVIFDANYAHRRPITTLNCGSVSEGINEIARQRAEKDGGRST